MKNFKMPLILIGTIAVFVGIAGKKIYRPSTVYTHTGICDASGVAFVDDTQIAVADDEMNMLLLYSVGSSGAAKEKFEISEFLNVIKKSKKKKAKKAVKQVVKEVDIEGAARLDNTVFWIASHGRKKSGKKAKERMRLFATSIENDHKRIKLVPDGIPYEDLLDDLLKDPRYQKLGLEKASKLSPSEEGGLNIEALTDTPSGYLYIGFRNPLINGKALIVTLLNPKNLLQEENAEFGDPILLDLGGLGFRGMASHEGVYLIVANDPEGDQHRPGLFKWDGKSKPQKVTGIEFGDFNPEAVAILPDQNGGQVVMLSDDGSKKIGDSRCKDLKDLELRQFRSSIISNQEIKNLPLFK